MIEDAPAFAGKKFDGTRARRGVGDGELRAALETVFDRRVAGMERRTTPYCTSAAIEELHVRLDDGETMRLMFKDLSRRAMLPVARRVKPAFLHDPTREIETYRAILDPENLGAPAFHGAVSDRGRRWLFMEKVEGTELYQIGDFSVWRRTAQWLALMHDRFAGRVEALSAPLLKHDEDYYRMWPRRAREFLSVPSQPKGVRRAVEWISGRYEPVVERLASLPTTFIHGEFYASNVLVRETVEGLRVCPVDWETAAVGSGVMDLASLAAGNWTASERIALALSYHAALKPRGGWPPPSNEFLTTLDHCRLHLAMQWLGWSPNWTPPPENAHDWLGEALTLADKLGL